MWSTCHYSVSKIDTALSKSLAKCIETRAYKLFNGAGSEPIFAAVFLDPRYQILLTPVMKEKAINHICQLQNKICSLELDDPQTSEPSTHDNLTNLFETGEISEGDELENLLKENEEQPASTDQPLTYDNRNRQDIKLVLQKFDGFKRLPKSQDVFKFWETLKSSTQFNILYQLANIVLAVPATQVTVERSFSTLKFVLSTLRSAIEPDLLEDILLINLNHKK